MIIIPDDILAQYESALKKRAITTSRHSEYRKWLRYYLDFCSKYPVPTAKSKRVQLFVVRTTMIYAHCVPSRTVKEVRSPLDF